MCDLASYFLHFHTSHHRTTTCLDWSSLPCHTILALIVWWWPMIHGFLSSSILDQSLWSIFKVVGPPWNESQIVSKTRAGMNLCLVLSGRSLVWKRPRCLDPECIDAINGRIKGLFQIQLLINLYDLSSIIDASKSSKIRE